MEPFTATFLNDVMDPLVVLSLMATGTLRHCVPIVYSSQIFPCADIAKKAAIMAAEQQKKGKGREGSKEKAHPGPLTCFD